MKTSLRWPDALKNSASVTDVLVHMGMASAHEKFRVQDAAYTAHVEELINNGLARKRRPTPRALAEEMNRAREARTGLFPITQEEAARAKTAALLAAIHHLLPVVCSDAEGNAITIYDAWESVDLLDAAVQAIYVLSDAKKLDSEEMLRCLRAAQELLKRKRAD